MFFSRGDNVASLNQAILYVLRNEHTNNLKVVTVLDESEELPERLRPDLEILDQAYPEMDVELVVNELSREWGIAKNFMFIASPGDHFPYRLEELGGVRLII